MNGDAYALVRDTVTTSNTFNVLMRMKTTSFSGVLWHLKDTTNSAHLLLRQEMGRLILLHFNSTHSTQLIIWSSDLISHAGTSYWLCDNKLKTITVERVGVNYKLDVDGRFSETS